MGIQILHMLVVMVNYATDLVSYWQYAVWSLACFVSADAGPSHMIHKHIDAYWFFCR